MSAGILPWKLKHTAGDPEALVLPTERLGWFTTIGFGFQHVVAMFGATFLVPVLTGFPPATTLLFSGIGTILFLIITRNRLPSYLGSSFALLAPVGAATASHGQSSALGGIVFVGVSLIVIGIVVHFAGTGWIEVTMPPIVTGTIVALIGFYLADIARQNFVQQPTTAVIVMILLICSLGFFRGMLSRLAILVSVVAGYFIAMSLGDVDTSLIADAAWFGFPEFHSPTFHLAVLPMFLPVVLVMVVENIGTVKSISSLTGINNDARIGRALAADGVATFLAGSGGGSATTTYSENVGVMAATRVYSTAAFWVAGLMAICLGLSPKVGAVIESLPKGVIGGITVVLFGLIGLIGVNIWVKNHVDFSDPINQVTAGLGLVLAVGHFDWQVGDLEFGGIELGAVAAVLTYHGMTLLQRARNRISPPPEARTAPSADTAPAAET